MAGALGRLDLIPPEDLAVGSRRLNVYEDALRAITERGLSLAGPPRGYKGEMPQELTSLDDEHLGDLLNNLSAWCAFVECELAKAAASKESAQANLDFIQARVRMALRSDSEGRKLTVQDKNDSVTTDPRVVEAQSQALFRDHVYTLTKTLRDKSQRDWETVSRRITQRGQEVERMKRESNVAGVPSRAVQYHRRPT